MADIIYALQVPAIQPAFVYGIENLVINFSLSPYSEEISAKTKIRLTLIDPSLKTAYGNNSKINNNDNYLDLVPKKKEGLNREYYITIENSSLKELNVNKYYQAQLLVVNENGTLSEPSQVTLIRPIPEIESVVFEQSGTNPLSFNTLSGYIKYIDDSRIEAIQNYYFTVENADGRYTSKTYINDLGTKFKCSFSDCYVYGESVVSFYYTTINGYKGEAFFDITIGAPNAESKEVGDLLIENNRSKGCIDIVIKDLLFSQGEEIGALSIQRKAFGKQNWEEIYRFKINIVEYTNTNIYWSDFSIDGQTLYEYRFLLSINGTNNYLLSKNNNTIFAIETDWNDIFLLDKNLQLAVRYNPTITGLKYVTQESFTNTLGSKFPIFKRNGQVKYKQFSLSGLLYFKENIGEEISCDSTGVKFTWLDDETESLYFYKDNKINTQLNNLIKRPLATERFIRDTVVDFLCDGKPKLFRSAAEGNMIVVLSGVSFTPNKTIGSSIYDFSATVTEICDPTLENLIKFGIQQPIPATDDVYILSTLGAINEIAYLSIDDIINNSLYVVKKAPIQIEEGE